jgi:isoaspartyl peptidase/L-asparaginase-like protein (Ntn-hydrolase superfamily)
LTFCFVYRQADRTEHISNHIRNYTSLFIVLQKMHNDRKFRISIASMNARILVHLGASQLESIFHAESLEWVRKAVHHGFEVAMQGALAQDIVAETVSVLEDCPVSDAGFGAYYNAKMEHQMDAGIMTGQKQYGAIASIHNVQNPIRVAKLVLNEDFSLLVGQGAMEFVEEKGIPLLPHEQFSTRYNEYVREHIKTSSGVFEDHGAADHGTVGCVARDNYGNIAAGTSTGGTPLARRGRVGDSPIAGCGVWADKRVACSCTGYGEAILREGLARNAARRIKKTDAMSAAKAAVQKFGERGKLNLAGVIMLTKETGEYGLYHNTDHMPFAMLNGDGTITSGLSVRELSL